MLRIYRSLVPTSTSTTKEPSTTATTTTTIGTGLLPIELLSLIFTPLTPLDLHACALTCRLFHKTASQLHQPTKPSPTPADLFADLADALAGRLEASEDVLHIKAICSVRSGDRKGTGNVGVGIGVEWLDPSSRRRMPKYKTNPIVFHGTCMSLEDLARHSQPSTWNPFRSPPSSSWPPRMHISNPPAPEVKMTIHWDHEFTPTWRVETLQRNGGVRVSDVARCVGKAVEGMKREVRAEEDRYRTRGKSWYVAQNKEGGEDFFG